jgi:hypothetical protein
MNAKTFSLAITILFLLASCNFKKLEEQSNQTFGDQHFKTAVSLIELHKVRYGAYPENLDSLKYLGEWDYMVPSSVYYEKLEGGYQLDLVNGVNEKPKGLTYPREFWQGLGCVKSNLK